MKVGEIYVQTRTVDELRYAPENMVVITTIADTSIYFRRLKTLSYANNSGVVEQEDFDHLFQFYF
ncbi:hypothetical protein VPHD51_0165 [Vibrio phage D51]